jgi:Sensors of blue-light using FAD
MNLSRLIYCSKAMNDLDYGDLKDIMTKSQKNNQPVGITGILCFGNGYFLQILEGHRQEISKTYNRIIQDTRHCDTEIIEFQEVEARLFTDWSMKVVQLGDFAPEKVNNLILKHSNKPHFNPSNMVAKQSLNFLIEFSELMK